MLGNRASGRMGTGLAARGGQLVQGPDNVVVCDERDPAAAHGWVVRIDHDLTERGKARSGGAGLRASTWRAPRLLTGAAAGPGQTRHGTMSKTCGAGHPGKPLASNVWHKNCSSARCCRCTTIPAPNFHSVGPFNGRHHAAWASCIAPRCFTRPARWSSCPRSTLPCSRS